MKLNLLPTYVSKEGQTRTAIVLSALIALVAIGAAAFMITYSGGVLRDHKAAAEVWVPAANAALATSQEADTIIASATGIDRNLKLSAAMAEHNKVYPELYRDVMDHIPAYFRVTSMSSTPIDAQNSAVTVTGVIETYQQYADIMLSLLRIPGAVNVARAGYTNPSMFVPNLNVTDQIGTPIRPGEPNLPSDPQARMEAILSRAAAAPTGFQNVGGFGTNQPNRGPMPRWSAISLVVTLARNTQTPDPRATIAQHGAAGGAAPALPGQPGQPPVPPPPPVTPPPDEDD